MTSPASAKRAGVLVLAIPRPEDGTDVRSFLEHQDAGKFIASLISFWVIALFWLAHHRLFRVVRVLPRPAPPSQRSAATSSCIAPSRSSSRRRTPRLYVLRILIVPAVFLLSTPVVLAQRPTAAQKLWLLSFIVPALGSLWMRRHGRRS